MQMKKVSISFTLNGDEVSIEVPITWTLLQSLREVFELTGAKEGCGVGECGACTVIVDGQTVNACIYPVAEIDGRQVTTIEGLSENSDHPLQKAWVDIEVAQCGYCQSGQIMRAASLLNQNPKPSREEIVETMSRNLCRCGTYPMILEAIEQVVEERSDV